MNIDLELDYRIDSFNNSLTLEHKMVQAQISEVNISMTKLYVGTITTYEGTPSNLNQFLSKSDFAIQNYQHITVIDRTR